MSWRRGELWLETDVIWFRERPGTPALAGAVAPVSIPRLSPPGLVASRNRRAAWKHRRKTRRARAAALALSPAVILPFAALRSGGGHETAMVVEDPPSLTFRLGSWVEPGERPVRPETAQESERVARRSPPAAAPTRARRAAPHAAAAPTIQWHHAISTGLPYDGTLVDGTQLPVEGPSWVTWNPVTDSVPNDPDRLYGNERTIRAIVSVTEAYRAANPDAPRVVIGDISFSGGGPMRDEHVSHQNGLDVDVYYPRLDGALRAPVASEEIDRALAQDLLDRFVAAGAEMVFVGYSTGLQGPTGVVVPYPNHEYHMHVRFRPPAG
jgi:hypothetical protein